MFCKWPRMVNGNPLEASLRLVSPLLTKNLDTVGLMMWLNFASFFNAELKGV